MSKPVTSIFLVFLLLLFSGCTSEAPEELTPSPSPTVRPQPETVTEIECIHFWKSPDCFEAYICYDCDERKGEPLEHIWTEANFQEPSICELCGETDGTPVEPGFIRHGLRINTTAGRPYVYKTITNQDPDKTTLGEATLLYIDIFESDTDYPEKSGYEYILAHLMITFGDENARESGFRYMTGQLDYFDFDPNESAVAHDDLPDSDVPDFKIANRKINFFDVDYEYFIKYTQVENVWVGDTSYIVLEYTFLVPVGYDGMVVYLSNAANFTEADNRVLSDNFDNDTLFFRLRVQTS